MLDADVADVDRNVVDSDAPPVVLLVPPSVAFKTAEDDEADVYPRYTSLLSGGRVVTSAAGSVTSVVALTFLVFTHRQLGVLLVVQSAVPPDAEMYVTAKFCALSVFVAAMLANGVGAPLSQCV